MIHRGSAHQYQFTSINRRPLKFLLILITILLTGTVAVTGCFPEAATSTSPSESTPITLISPPAVLEIEPVTAAPLQATAAPPTLPATVTRVETLTPTPENCSFAFFFEPAPGTCPRGEAVSTAAAEQPFEGGTMVWLEELDAIFVIYSDQRWVFFEDTWSEDQPEMDPTISTPVGFYQPIRGFGKVWRERPGVRERLGWAKSQELGFETFFQEQDSGDDDFKITYLRMFNGQVAALTERSENQGDWVQATSP